MVGYHVSYATTISTNIQKIDVGTATNTTISGLDDAITYSFLVAAYDKDGVEGFPSNEVSINQGRIANLSTRASVGNYSTVLINGFIIGGTSEKTVVLRALGPSLSQFGVTGALNDPVLKVFDSTATLIASNDNWRDTQETAFAEGGPFHAFQPTNDSESAIAITLPPGSYTSIVSGKNGRTGVALSEVYDASPGADSTLTNISARAYVARDDNVLIGGVTIDGQGTATRGARLILRAIGPSLAFYGLANTLSDPTLSLFDANGTSLASNDNWGDDPYQASLIMASGFAPNFYVESAMVVLLPAGNYTAIVRGKDGQQGVALFDTYQVP